jgi:hypothetical protein
MARCGPQPIRRRVLDSEASRPAAAPSCARAGRAPPRRCDPPPRASYRRHRDRFHDDDERVLSCALYLNESWADADGGALRIYLDGGAARDILPVGGTLVCFLSDRFEHKVLPATHERLALTGWLRRRAL